MKIFVSWSGETSHKIAETLKTWIPSMIQSVEIFFSSEDIEKGSNWDQEISTELSECNYGIICLTKENTSAPWINFEAGALSKSLESKVSALMIGIKTSDIQGPLSRYQATKFEKEDFFLLIESINNALDTPVDSKVLQNTFDGLWPKLNEDAQLIISESEKNVTKQSPVNKEETQAKNDPLEEILQLLRKQNMYISTPDILLPESYIEDILRKMLDQNIGEMMRTKSVLSRLLDYMDSVISRFEEKPYNPMIADALHTIDFDELFNIFLSGDGNISKMYFKRLTHLKSRYYKLLDKPLIRRQRFPIETE